MKKAILSVVVVMSLALTNCKNEAKQAAGTLETTESETTTETSKVMAMADISFGVRGNCGMCKKTIETAANGVEGVSKATWDVKKKKIDVAFDDSKTNATKIHEAIANSGYDTEKATANEAAYEKLPSCCKYDHDMAMNQDGE